MLSCCRTSGVADYGSDVKLKPESQHWKLVLDQRLEHFFNESCIPFPAYIKNTLETITKSITEDATAQKRAIAYQKEFQQSIIKYQKKRKTKKGILSDQYEESDMPWI